MTGLAEHVAFPVRMPTPELGTEILRVEALHGHRLQGLSLSASAGQILGIAGLAGSGRSELLRLIAGDQRMRGGQVLLDGVPVAGGSVRRAMERGIALVPAEQRRQGLVMTASIRRNIALANEASAGWLGLASRRRERAVAERGIGQLRSLRRHALGPRCLAPSASCLPAISRRSCWRGISSASRACSCSTNRPAASTSARENRDLCGDSAPRRRRSGSDRGVVGNP